MTLQTDLETAIAQVLADSLKLKDIVNGDAAMVVTVDSGPVKSVAKAIAEIGDTSNQAAKDLGNVLDTDFSAKAAGAGVGFGDVVAANNLSDIANATAARTNLGIGAAAVEAVATGGTGGLLRADGDGSNLTGIVSGATTAEKANIMLNAFRIAVNGALTIQNMVDGRADVFTDQTGVDTISSLNESYDAVNHLYANGGTPTTMTNTANLVSTTSLNLNTYTFTAASIGTAATGRLVVIAVDMNGWTAPVSVSGVTVGGNACTLLRDSAHTPGEQSVSLWSVALATGTTGDIVVSTSPGNINWTAISVWAVYDANPLVTTTGTAAASGTATAVGFTATIPANGAAIAMAVQNVTSSWGAALTAAFDTVSGGSRRYTVATATPATVQTLAALTNTPGGTSTPNFMVGGVWSAANPSALDMSLISNPMTALSQPTKAFVVVWQEDVGAVILNTDLKAWASRDGGTTWTQVTLAESAALATGRILTGTTDISAQPVGTAMKYKIETLNARELKIHGVALNWS